MYGPKNVVFMSSATVYGVPEQLPVIEGNKTGADITNPYGWAKYMVEQMLRDICQSSKVENAKENILTLLFSLHHFLIFPECRTGPWSFCVPSTPRGRTAAACWARTYQWMAPSN
jgi:hypothetical protein